MYKFSTKYEQSVDRAPCVMTHPSRGTTQLVVSVLALPMQDLFIALAS
jgi:hypothetical protein